MWSAGDGRRSPAAPGRRPEHGSLCTAARCGRAPAAVVQTQLDRKLLEFGQGTLNYLMLLISAIVGIVALVMMGLLLRMEKVWRDRTASERRYRRDHAGARNTLLLADAGSRRILEANPAATTTLGYPESELLARTVDELFVVNDGGTVRPVQPELCSVSLELALQVRRHDGELLDVEVSASPLAIDGREVISFILRDVSAQER